MCYFLTDKKVKFPTVFIFEKTWQKNYNTIFCRGYIFDMQVANTNTKNLNLNYHHEKFTCCLVFTGEQKHIYYFYERNNVV